MPVPVQGGFCPGYLKAVWPGFLECMFEVWPAPGPRESLQKCGGFRPRPSGMVFGAAGAAQTQKIDDCRPAQKPCIKSPSVIGWHSWQDFKVWFSGRTEKGREMAFEVVSGADLKCDLFEPGRSGGALGPKPKCTPWVRHLLAQTARIRSQIGGSPPGSRSGESTEVERSKIYPS